MTTALFITIQCNALIRCCFPALLRFIHSWSDVLHITRIALCFFAALPVLLRMICSGLAAQDKSCAQQTKRPRLASRRSFHSSDVAINQRHDLHASYHTARDESRVKPAAWERREKSDAGLPPPSPPEDPSPINFTAPTPVRTSQG